MYQQIYLLTQFDGGAGLRFGESGTRLYGLISLWLSRFSLCPNMFKKEIDHASAT